jgi:hypothetical protein
MRAEASPTGHDPAGGSTEAGGPPAITSDGKFGDEPAERVADYAR